MNNVFWERCNEIRATLGEFPRSLREYFVQVEDPELEESFLVPKDGVRLWRFTVVLSALPAPVRGFKLDNPMELFVLETPNGNYLFSTIEDDFGAFYVYNIHRLKPNNQFSEEEADHA